MNNEHHPEFDLSQITEFIYLGTNLCCLYKPHIQILFDAGVTAEIDLEKERQDPAPDIGIYLWLPVEDKHAPTMEQFFAGVSLLTQMTKLGKKTFVHCEYGHGRSPTLVAAYLISEGSTVTEAIDIIKASRPEIHLEEEQIKSLEEYYQLVNR